MVAAALCIPCITAPASAGPGAPVVLGASAIGAAGYYTFKKSRKKCYKKKKKPTKKKKHNKKKKSSMKGGSKKCCVCHYVKTKKTIRKVKGPYEHCSYDSDNCCKDKKNIIKSKTKRKH